MNVECPCYQCDEREVGCHGKCDAYKEYTELNETHKQNVRDGMKNDKSYNEYAIKNFRKLKKRRGRK